MSDEAGTNAFDDVTSVGIEAAPAAQELAHSPESTRSVPQRKTWGHAVQVIGTALPLFVADLVALTASLWLAWAVFHVLPFGGPYLLLSLLRQSGAIVAIMLVVFPFAGLYPGTGLNPVVEFRQSIIAASVTYGLVLIANAVFGRLPIREFCLLTTGWFTAIMVLPLLRQATRRLCAAQPWWGQSVLVIGNGQPAATLFDLLQKQSKLGLRPVGILGDPHEHWRDETTRSETYLGPVEDLQEVARRHRVYWAILTMEDLSRFTIETLASAVPNLVVLTDMEGLPSLWTRVQECAGKPAIHIQERLLLPLPQMTKRAIDLTAVVVGGALISPVLVLIALAIKLTSRGPAFYGHERIGLNGRRFNTWKFRTMRVNADQLLQRYLDQNPEAQAEWERDHKLKHDPRIIPGIGRLLRALSLDELPQLWNVVLGEMSLVGPRPIVNAEIEKYRDSYPMYLRVVPGITGLWQVSGRNNTTYEQRVQFDTYYVRNWSPWLDAYILARTIKVVFLREGAY